MQRRSHHRPALDGWAFLFFALSAAGLLLASHGPPNLRGPAIALGFAAAALLVHEVLGRPLPFLRWSVLRMGTGLRNVIEHGQVGDGRERKAVDHVLRTSAPGDIDGAIDAIDAYAYRHQFLMNIGDEKGELLDDALRRRNPASVLEVGSYIGYSALRIVRQLAPESRLVSVEFSAANVELTERLLHHTGAASQAEVLHGTIGEAHIIDALRDRCPGRAFELVFLDHDKDAYLVDLKKLLSAGLLTKGTVVVADNLGVMGSSDYREYMAKHQGTLWSTQSHKTHLEYQKLIPDMVLVSTLLKSP